MAFNKTPSTWLGAGYTLSSSVIGLRTSTAGTNVTLPQLTDTEANASSGDIREIVFAIVDKLYNAYNTTAIADRPTKMTILRSGSTTATGNIQYTYTFQIEVETTGVNVASE